MTLLTLGAGGAGSLPESIQAAFANRVALDGGVIESSPSAITAMSAIDAKGQLGDASFMFVPSGVKSGKVYAQVPSNGNGDMTFTRASVATRLGSDGLIASVASGVPRLDSSLGGAPTLLLEPQRTNQAFNTLWAGAVAGTPGTFPTGWGTGVNSGRIDTVTALGNGANRITFTTTAQRHFCISNAFNTVANRTYVLSIYIDSYSGSIPLNTVLAENAAIAGTVKTYYYQDGTNLGNGSANIAAAGRYYIVYSNTAGGNVTLWVGLGVLGNITGSVTLSMPMFESGNAASIAYPSTYIATSAGAASTRQADTISTGLLVSNNLISNDGWTWYIELKNLRSLIRDASAAGLFIDSSATGVTNGFAIRSNNSTAARMQIMKYVAGTPTELATFGANSAKIAIVWNSATLTADIYVNGTRVVTATAFSPINLQWLGTIAGDLPREVSAIAMWNYTKSDAQCTNLTS